MEEKMAPWLNPIQDNLQFLMGNDKLIFAEYLDRGIIEIRQSYIPWSFNFQGVYYY